MMRFILGLAAPAALLLLLVLVCYAPAIAQGLMLAPADGLGYYLAPHVLVGAALRHGTLPFWNPYSFGGMPLMATLQGGVFFPGNLPFLWLPPAAAMDAAVLLAYWITGIGVFAFMRALELRSGAAFAAAIAATFSGFWVGHLEHLAVIQVAALLPWLLWAIERFRRTLATRFAIAAMAVLTLQIFAGHPQTLVFGLLLAVPYALFRGAGLRVGEGGLYFRQLGCALALGFGLALLQLVPAFELLLHSQRQAMPYDALVATALSPKQLLSLLFPFLFGAPPSAWFPTPYWGGGQWPDELCGYAGLATLMLAVCALFGRHKGQARFWAAVAAIAALLALGGATPLYHVWAQLPLLKIMRVPGRHLMELDLALAVLAGLGFEHLLTAPPKARLRAAAFGWGLCALAIALLLGGVYEAGPRLAAKLQPLLPADVHLAQGLALTQPALWLPAVLCLVCGAAVLRLAQRPGVWRQTVLLGLLSADLIVFSQHQGWWQHSPRLALDWRPRPGLELMRTLSVADTPYPYFDMAKIEALHYPSFGALQGDRPAGGYEPMLASRYGRLMAMSDSGVTGDALWKPTDHMLDLTSVRWLRVDSDLLVTAPWHDRLVPPRWKPISSGSGVSVFENLRALPRAWRPRRALVLPAPNVDALLTDSGAFSATETALLEQPTRLASLSPGFATLVAQSANSITLRTQGAGPGIVVVSEGYDAGWRASLGDKPLRVERADGVLLGVEVPAGRQEVTLTYVPPHWRAGLAGSCAALLLAIAWALRATRKRRARVQVFGWANSRVA